MIRPVREDDAAAIAQIYNHYIVHTVITFEEVAVDATTIAARVANVTAKALPWLVIEEAGVVVGYAYAAPWRERSAYRFAVEASVYLSPQHLGQGRGSRLYRALIERLAQTDCHAVIGGVALPNDASVALHERLGMAKVAHFHEVGYKLGRWVDVGYWQKNLVR